MPFVVMRDNQPQKTLESLATKITRIQRWYDCLSAYTYKLVYRPGKLNGNADLISRLRLTVTKDALEAELHLADPADIDAYFIGASGVQPRLRGRAGTILGGMAMQTCDHSDGGGGNIGRRHQPRTSRRDCHGSSYRGTANVS